MDTLRSLVTLAAFLSFLGIVWWAYAPSRKDSWERQGQLEKDEE